MKKENSTNHINQVAITKGCPITSTVIAIGGRWKIIILWQLKNGPLRYNEVRKAIPHISEKMLIQQLKEFVSREYSISKWADEIINIYRNFT